MSDEVRRLHAAARFYVERAVSLEARGAAPFAAEMAEEARALAALMLSVPELVDWLLEYDIPEPVAWSSLGEALAVADAVASSAPPVPVGSPGKEGK